MRNWSCHVRTTRNAVRSGANRDRHLWRHLKEIPAPELGTAAIRATLERAQLDGAGIDTVVMGQVVQAGSKMNPARQAAIAAGIPVSVPAMTVNRVCGSGAQAIATAAQEVMLGFIKSAIAGGMENMDQSPYLMSGGRWGYRMGDAQIRDSMLRDGLNDAFSGEHSGWVTENLVAALKVSRDEQDRWALRSQTRFSKAQAAGRFSREIAPVEIRTRKGTAVFERDEHNRADTTIESLSRLKPVFAKVGPVPSAVPEGAGRKYCFLLRRVACPRLRGFLRLRPLGPWAWSRPVQGSCCH